MYDYETNRFYNEDLYRELIADGWGEEDAKFEAYGDACGDIYEDAFRRTVQQMRGTYNLVIIDECGDEFIAETYELKLGLDADEFDIWCERKMAPYYESYPEARAIFIRNAVADYFARGYASEWSF